MVFSRCPNCNSALGVKPLVKMKKFRVLFCPKCLNGVTLPVPGNMAIFYPESYWTDKSLIGSIKLVTYRLFQKRRKNWIEKYLSSGVILDVGAGEGEFGKYFNNQFRIFNLEASWARLTNPKVLKVDFLKWETGEKFNAITFWESLEHTPSPRKYLEKAYKLLKGEGLVFIEYPRFNCFESRLFGRFWYHLDLPRHLSHLTDRGLENLLQEAGFKVIEYKTVFAPEYYYPGFMVSFLKLFNINLIDLISKKSQNQARMLIIALLISPVFILSILVVEVFRLSGQSAIGLIVAKRLKHG